MSSDVAVERRFRSRASSSATVSKAPPPSPLYYDYSENFFPEDEMGEPNLQLEPMEVPNPPFYLERTIHEDRELSSDWSYLAMTDLQGRGFLASEGLTVGVLDTSRTHQGTDISYAGAIKASPLRSVETFSGFDDDASLSPTPSNLANHNRRIPRMRSQVGMLGLDGTDDSVHSSEQAVSPTVFRPTASGIWLANGKENSHNVHEAVEGADDNASRRKATFPFKPGHLLKVSTDSTYLPEELSVEKPDAKERKSEDDSNEFSMSIAKQVSISEHTVIRADGASCSLATPKCSADTSRAHQDGASRQGCTSFMDDGGNQQAVAVGQRSGFTATPNEISALRHDGHPQQSDIEIQGSSRMSKNKSDGNLKASGLVLEHSPIKARYLSSEYAIGSAELRKVERSRRESHQSSTSEILSPTPTYPARELHVKNSIPQLMKALPPLPLRETSEFMPSQPARTSKLQSKRPPPLQLDSCQKASNALSPVTPLNDQGSPSQQQQQAPATQPFLSRFKLKPRSPAIPPEPSPPTTRPWNLEESYPWNSAASDSMPSPGLGHSKSGIIAPKLRLRMAKRSITSLGTVRVNREGASTSSAMEDIGTPNDLFSSPSSGLAGMFRQVSKRFQSGENQRNDAAVINLLSAEDASTSKLQRRTYAVDSKAKSGSKALDQTTLTELSTASSISSLNGLDGATRSSSIKLVKVSAKKTPNTYINTASTTEKATLKGMFQASKNESVRRKISGLKAKATASFSRSSSRNSVDVLAGHKASSASGLLRTARKSPVRRTRRIKNKITIWFRGAKKSVLGCVRLRPGSESSGAAPSKATG